MKKGFTMIELLATIVILASLMLIIIPLITGHVKKSQVTMDTQTENNIVLAAKNWASDNKEKLPSVKGSISVEDLIAEGYLNTDVNDQFKNSCVVISNENNIYYYKYAKDEKKCKNGIYKHLTFNAEYNGGVYNRETIRVYVDKKVKLDKAIKSEWDFVGWSENKDAKSGYTDTYTMPNRDVTLYAIFKKDFTYNLTLDKNGGSGTEETQTCSGTVYNKETPACEVQLPDSKYTKNLYEFTGWAENTSATGEAIKSPGTTISLTSDKTYYAMWNQVEAVYYAYFYVNGTKRYTKNCTAKVGSSCSVTTPTPASSYIPTGYTFKGWGTSTTATRGTAANTAVSISANKNYYAVLADSKQPSIYIKITSGSTVKASGTNTTVTASGWQPAITLDVTITDYNDGTNSSSGCGNGFSSGKYTINYGSSDTTRTGTLSGCKITDKITMTTEGARTVKISVTDKSGNTRTATAKFNLDNKPPEGWTKKEYNANYYPYQWGQCGATDSKSGIDTTKTKPGGTYTYTKVGAGCSYTGTWNIDVNTSGLESNGTVWWFNFGFQCGTGSTAYWTCPKACDKVGNCVSSYKSSSHSW